jgi:hypothetical protein
VRSVSGRRQGGHHFVETFFAEDRFQPSLRAGSSFLAPDQHGGHYFVSEVNLNKGSQKWF